jgi:hypothetical protein
VFVSVPDDRHLDVRRRALKRAIIRFVAKQKIEVVGFEPHQFGLGLPVNRDIWTLERARKLIRKSDGALILALARTHVRIMEPETAGAGRAISLPTVYNHLEGARAIAADLPAFILF